jgi:hypothetical protein
MFFTRTSVGRHTWRQLTPFSPDLDQPFALQNVVNFVGSLMLMWWLFLSGLEAIDITKHALGFEHVDLLKLLGSKACARGKVRPRHVSSPFWVIVCCRLFLEAIPHCS